MEWANTQAQLLRFAGSDESVIHAEGPTQSGKSYALGHAFTAYIGGNHWPTGQGFDGFLVLGPSMVQVGGMLKNIEEATERLGGKCDLRADGTAYVNGHKVLGKPIAHQGSRKGFHGGRFGAVLVDEVTLCDQETYEYAVGRVVVPPLGSDHGKLMTGTNPDSPHHWFHVRTDELRERVVHSTIDDNPSLTQRIKDDLKAQWAGVMLDRMYFGRRAAHSGLVWPFFGEQVVQGLFPENAPHSAFVSLDCGNRNATHAIYWHRWINHMRAVDEWVYDGRRHGPRSTADQVKALGEWLNGRPAGRIYYDPAALDFGLELQQLGSGLVRPAENAVDAGIQQVMLFMNRGVLSIDAAKCPVTVRECSAYSWDPLAARKGMPDKPLKVNDHGADAFRYGVYSETQASRIRMARMA